MNSGYENIYADLLPQLARCDIVSQAEALGLNCLSADKAAIRFLTRDYEITLQGVVPTDGRETDVNDLSIIIYYILSAGRREPEEVYVPLKALAGPMAGQVNHAQSIMVKPIMRALDGNSGKLAEAAAKLEGRALPVTGAVSQAWRFQLLPRIPLKLVYYEADEDFPAEMQLLYDHKALDFLEFECLAFLTGCFARTLIRQVRLLRAD